MTWHRIESTHEASEPQPAARVAPASPPLPTTPPRTRKRISLERRVAVLGDSIVADGLLVHYLRRALGSDWVVDNYGLNCDTPGQMLRRVRRSNYRREPKVIVPTRYGVVIVLGGINGIYPDIDANNGARTQLAALFRRLKTLGIADRHPKVVGLTMPPWGNWRGWSLRQQQHTQMLNRWLVGLPDDGRSERSVAPPDVDLVLDLHAALVDPSSLEVPDHNGNIRPRLSRQFTDDGLHLNLAGARQVAEWIGNALTRRSPPAPKSLEAVSEAVRPYLTPGTTAVGLSGANLPSTCRECR